MQEAFLILNATCFFVICLAASSTSVHLSWVRGSEWSTRNALFAAYSFVCVFSAVLFLEPYPISLFPLLTFHGVVVLIIPAGYRYRAPRLKGNKA